MTTETDRPAPSAADCLSIEEFRRRSQPGSLPTEHVDVPGFGRLLVRALTLADIAEATTAPELVGDVTAEKKFLMVRAMVAPALSPEDVGLFDNWTVGQINSVMVVIYRLSGMAR